MEGMQIFYHPKANLYVDYKLINYIRCKPILGHLLFCNRPSNKGQNCLMCTRMVCRSKRYSNKVVDELTTDALNDLNNVFEWMPCKQLNCALSLICYIDKSILSNCCISDEKENFYDVNPFGANQPSLIFVNLFTVASRVTINYLYRNLNKEWHSGFLAKPTEEPLHNKYVYLVIVIVKGLCRC